jgi:peroxin-5
MQHFGHPMGMMMGMMGQPQLQQDGNYFEEDEDNYAYDQSQGEVYSSEVDYEGEQYEGEMQELPTVSSVETSQVTASKQGLDSAWGDLQARLQTGELSGQVEAKADYNFVNAQENPFMDATRQEPLNIAEAMERGMKLFREGKIRDAIMCFESVVQDSAGSEHDEAWRMLGACHAENDEDKRAIYCLNKCLDCDPYNLEALLALGTSYVNELDSVKALETLRTWVAHNPRYQGLDSGALDAYSDGTLMDEVTQLMLMVSAHDPLDIDVKIVLGVLYNVSLDYDGAIDCFTQACGMRPGDYSLLNKVLQRCVRTDYLLESSCL